MINRCGREEKLARTIGCKERAANLCKCWNWAGWEVAGGLEFRRLNATRNYMYAIELKRGCYKMAGIFAHAWKSHILQDFQFPQRFPQQTTSWQGQKPERADVGLAPKSDAVAVLTPKLPQTDRRHD